jgi:hypothetical protein
MCFHILCLKHPILREEPSEIWLKISIGRQVKFLLFVSGFNETLIFSYNYGKIL